LLFSLLRYKSLIAGYAKAQWNFLGINGISQIVVLAAASVVPWYGFSKAIVFVAEYQAILYQLL
jgi:hypothetical protein